jgi:hypothetical protein
MLTHAPSAAVRVQSASGTWRPSRTWWRRSSERGRTGPPALSTRPCRVGGIETQLYKGLTSALATRQSLSGVGRFDGNVYCLLGISEGILERGAGGPGAEEGRVHDRGAPQRLHERGTPSCSTRTRACSTPGRSGSGWRKLPCRARGSLPGCSSQPALTAVREQRRGCVQRDQGRLAQRLRALRGLPRDGRRQV